jgi:hypothetical protein
MGKFPLSQIPLSDPVKKNFPVLGVLAFSCCTHAYTAVKIRKARNRTQPAPAQPAPAQPAAGRKTLEAFNVLTDKQMLASFTSNIISLASLVIAYGIAFTLNAMPPEELNRGRSYETIVAKIYRKVYIFPVPSW